jgi:steroid 5-alpha reductase family enzyme
MVDQLLSLFGWGAAVLFVLFTITWCVQLKTGNAGIVDTVWSFSFPVLASLYYSMTDGDSPRKLLILIMVVIWGIRLALHLLIRTIGHKEDKRYTALRETWGSKQNILMLRFFYFQAILALALSLPFALMMINPAIEISWLEWTGAGIWLIAVIGEATADGQLKKFIADPANKGKVCEVGLWYYSRHPNYFFEWLIWLAFFIASLSSPWGFLSFICPVFMLYFLLKVTGIPYTEEQSIKSKGQLYRDYQKTTSPFVPLPKKTNA